MYIGRIHSSYYSCCILSYMYIVWCIQLIMYCMIERTMGTVRTYCLSSSPLLLLLIVIYDGALTYNEATIVDWYVDNDDDDVELCQSIC